MDAAVTLRVLWQFLHLHPGPLARNHSSRLQIVRVCVCGVGIYPLGVGVLLAREVCICLLPAQSMAANDGTVL